MGKPISSLISGGSSAITHTASKASSTINSSKSVEQALADESRKITNLTFDFNKNEAQKERDWSEYMSNTSHQREVADLRASGLNPVLSANSGANSYSGASASGSADNSAIGAISSIYQTKMSNQNAMAIAKMNNKTAIQNKRTDLKIAEINAAANRYASDTAYSASRYASDQSASASKYGTDHSKYGMVDNFFSNLLNDDSGKNTGSKVRKFISDTVSSAKKTDTYKKVSEAYTRRMHRRKFK